MIKTSRKYLEVLERWAEKNVSENIKECNKKIDLLICPYCGQVVEVLKVEKGKDLKVQIAGEKNCKDCTTVSILEPTIFAWIGRVLGFQQIQKGG